MIIYNTSKELESKYMAQDDFVFEIHSQFTLDELLTKIRNGEEITPDIANIVAYSSKENSKFKDATTLEQNDYLDNMGYDIIPDPDDVEDAQTAYTESLRKRADLLTAFEKYAFNQETPGYHFTEVPFTQEQLANQLYACLGIMPTLKEIPDKTVSELRSMSADGERLYLPYAGVSANNKLPRPEDIEFYRSLNDYEKKVIADSEAHPMRLLDLAKAIKDGDKDRIFTESDTFLAERNPILSVETMCNISKTPGIERNDRLEHDSEEDCYYYSDVARKELPNNIDLKTANIIAWIKEEYSSETADTLNAYTTTITNWLSNTAEFINTIENPNFGWENPQKKAFYKALFTERVIPENVLKKLLTGHAVRTDLIAYYDTLYENFHPAEGKDYTEELQKFAKKSYKMPMTRMLQKAEDIFKELYHGHAPRVLAEYMYAQLTAKGIKPQNATDEQIREIAEKFDQKNIQLIAKYKNTALFAMADKLKFGEMRTDHIQVIATYADKIKIKKLLDKKFPEWYVEHKDTNTSDLVQLFENQHKISSFTKSLSARQIIVRENNKRGMEDCAKFERKYHIKFSENELAIRGRNVVAESGNMKMYMLPKDDYRNFTVGYDTNCCQHYDNAGESCVYKAVTDPFAGTVVIEKNHKILAQAFVWTDESKDTFVFDNMEFANDGQVASYMSIIAGYCEAMPYKNIHMGMGYNTLGNGIGKPINNEEEAQLPTTIAWNPERTSWARGNKDVYSDYHVTDGGNKARVLKRNGRTFINQTTGVRITAGADEPTRWDLLARPETAFMLNDYRSTIDERLRFANMLHGNPDLQTQMEAVQKDPKLIGIIANPLPEVQVFAVEQDRSVAHLIQNPCDEVQVILIGDDPNYIRNVIAPSEAVCVGVLQKNGLLLEDIMKKVRTGEIPMPGRRVFETAVNQNGYAIRQVPMEFQTEDLQLLAVASSPKVVSLLVNPTEVVQKTALDASPDVIGLMEAPTPEIQTYAIAKDPSLINSIEGPCYEAVKLAVERNGLNIRNYQNTYPELRAIAISQNPFIVTNGVLKNVSDEEYLQAARINQNVIRKLSHSNPELYANIQMALQTRQTPQQESFEPEFD